MIRDRHKTPSKANEPELYIPSVGDNQLDTNEDNKDLAQNQTLGSPLRQNSEEFYTYDGMDENDKQKLNQLKPIIWEENLINESNVRPKVVTDSQVRHSILFCFTKELLFFNR